MAFINSENIKFYPSGYRGKVKVDDTWYSIDPESKLNTEENVTRSYNVLIPYKNINQFKEAGSLIITKNYHWSEAKTRPANDINDIFEFIIHGYYLKILHTSQVFSSILENNPANVYAHIRIKEKGIPETSDPNNIYLSGKAVISSNNEHILNNPEGGSTTNYSNLDYTVDNNIIFYGLELLTTTPTIKTESDSNGYEDYYFKILARTGDNEPYDYIVPTLAKLMISLDDIYGGYELDAANKTIKTDTVKSTSVESANITNTNNIGTGSLTTDNINNLKLEVTKAATHTNGLNIETLGETNPNQEKVFLNVHYDKTTDQDPRRGFTLKEASGSNSVNIISKNNSGSDHNITFEGNNHTFAEGSYSSSKKSGEECITVAGNEFDVVTRDSNQWLNSNKRWIHTLESADNHFLQINYDDFNPVPNGYDIEIWDNMGGEYGQYGDTTLGISHYIQSSSHLNKKGYTLANVHRKWRNSTDPTSTTHEPLGRWYNEIGILDPTETEGTNFLSPDDKATKTQMYVAYKVYDGSYYKLKERAIITPESLSIENVNNDSTDKNFIAYLKNTTDDTYPKIGVAQAVNNTFDDVIYLSPNGIRMKYEANTGSTNTIGFNPRSNGEIIATTCVNKSESNTDDSMANVGLIAKYFKSETINTSEMIETPLLNVTGDSIKFNSDTAGHVSRIKSNSGNGLFNFYKNESDQYAKINAGALYLDGYTTTYVLEANGATKAKTLYLEGTGTATDTILQANGVVQGKSFYATSDKRLKENIQPFEYDKSILDLPVYTYTYKDSDKEQIGCMAQDLQKLYSQLVSEDKNGYLSVDNSKVVYLLLEEVKLLKKEIEDLKKSK